MKISAWRRVAASAFVAALVVGCVVSSGDDDNGNDGGVSGGSGGKGGSGGSTAGKSGSGGSSGSTAGTGGSAGSTAPYTCEPKDGGSLGSTPGTTCAAQDPSDVCQTCVQSKCCAEWKACTATSPNNPCGFGSPINGSNGRPEGEIICFQDCIFTALQDGGTASQDTQRQCAGQCTSPGCGTPAGTTSDLIACLDQSCFTECLQN